jgi:peptidoglycan/LPS O-acetylase OafA/YrhL
MTVVVLGAVVLVAGALPQFDPVRMDEVSLGVVASGLYVMNWLLAARAADYFAAGLQASPVQHFWTLAVEEQFYLLWPALLLAAAWWSRRADWSLRPALAAAFLAVTIASLTYSVYSTQLQAGAAYFSTLTHGWELALGGLLALVPTSRLGRQPRWVAFALERVMNSICNGLGMGKTGTSRKPSRPWNPHFYAIFTQVHNTL